MWFKNRRAKWRKQKKETQEKCLDEIKVIQGDPQNGLFSREILEVKSTATLKSSEVVPHTNLQNPKVKLHLRKIKFKTSKLLQQHCKGNDPIPKFTLSQGIMGTKARDNDRILQDQLFLQDGSQKDSQLQEYLMLKQHKKEKNNVGVKQLLNTRQEIRQDIEERALRTGIKHNTSTGKHQSDVEAGSTHTPHLGWGHYNIGETTSSLKRDKCYPEGR